MPTDAKPKSAPALLIVDGAGVRNSDFLGPIRYAQKGFIAMTINAHGIPQRQAKEFYAALDSGELKDYAYAVVITATPFTSSGCICASCVPCSFSRLSRSGTATRS